MGKYELTDYISLEPKEHIYTNIYGKRYISVTQFIENFVNSFEDVKDYWILYKAIQYCSDIDRSKIKNYSSVLDKRINIKKYTWEYVSKKILYPSLSSKDVNLLWQNFEDDKLELSIVTDIIKKFWKEENKKSTSKGTKRHNKEEEDQYIKGYYVWRGIKYKVHPRGVYNIYNLEPGIYPEIILWSDEDGICGTCDQLIVLEHRHVVIRDFKTNKVLKLGNKYDNMLEPLNDFPDCNMSHYKVQLNIYGYFLVKMGYIIDEYEIEHILDEGDKVYYPVKDIQYSINKLMKWNTEKRTDIKV